MYQGRPYGLSVVGKPLTEKDKAFIDNSAKKLTNLKGVSGVESLRLVYNLPDGGYFIIQDMGSIFKVVAHKPIYIEQPITLDGLAKESIPMLFSGAIAGANILRSDQGLGLKITEQTRKRVLGYGDRLAPKNISLFKFACKCGLLFQEFVPEKPNPLLIYTQYGKHRPTWYTGAMAELMQIVGGYGIQNLADLPDNELERAVFTLPSNYKDRVISEIGTNRLPAYYGVPHEKGEFQLDYKYLNTDIISFDELGDPWLVKIDASGVWAMPMPVIPASRTLAFRDYIEEVGDTELLAILDRFGAMPSGESFPVSSSAFQAWVRAGVITKVCDTADFYNGSAYSSAMGWSANTNGSEVVNTCYNIDLVTGKFTGRAYKLRLRLKSADKQGWVTSRTSDQTRDIDGLSKYLSFVYQMIGADTAINHAIKYKINKTPLSDIAGRAVLSYNETELDYWNNKQLNPIASHVGNMVMIDEGNFYGGRTIKVPEPMFDCCVSLPVPPPIAGNTPGEIDVIVLAYFLGNSLKTVKLFNDPSTAPDIVSSNFEDYMYVGSWSEHKSIGGRNVQCDIYTSDIDNRELVAPTEIITDIEGKDLGYTAPHHSFDFYFWRTGDFYRFRHYTTKTNKTVINGKTIMPAVAIPYFCRDIILYAQRDTYFNKEESESLTTGSVRDPNYYRFWTDAQSLFLFGNLPVQKGTPYPIEGRPNWAEIHISGSDEASSFADNGDWLGGLPVDITKMMYQYEGIIWGKESHPPAPTVDTYSKNTTTRYGLDSTLLCQVFDKAEKIGEGLHGDDYYYLSIGGSDITFYRDACKVVFGDIIYANISEPTVTGNRKQWGKTMLVDNQSAHHFIGVINE